MHQLKRAMALLLAVTLLGGLFIGSISAKGNDPHEVETGDKTIPHYSDVPASHKSADAIYSLTAINVLSGYTDGSFRPDGTITRAEFSVFVYRMLGYTEADKAYFGAMVSAFKDVPEGHWAEPFINACAKSGLFVGYPDGTFKPEFNVSKAEAITVVLRCLGYDSRLPGDWPSNYVNKAANIGIISLNGFISNQFATRAEVSEFCASALPLGLVTYLGKDSLGVALGFVDLDGYVYINGRTNEGWWGFNPDFEYRIIPLIVKMGYYFDTYDAPIAAGEHRDLREAAGWYISDVKKGQIMLIDRYNVRYPVASRYYIAGGDVTALGNISDARLIAKLANDEVVFVSSGIADRNYKVKNGTPFGVVASASKTELVMHSEVNGGASWNPSEYNEVFYSLDRHQFIDVTELKAGDVIYIASFQNIVPESDGDLYLVLSPKTGNFTEYDDAPEEYVVIDGKRYDVDAPKAENNEPSGINSFASYDGGMSYLSFADLDVDTHKNLSGSDDDVSEFGKVQYIIALTGRLATIGKDLTVAPTPDTYGIVTGFTVVDKGIVWDPTANGGHGGLNHLYMYNGVTLTLADGKTKDVIFTNKTNIDGVLMPAFELDSVVGLPFTFGDLISVNGTNIYTQDSNGPNKLYGFRYALMDETKYDTVTKLGSRLNVQWDVNNDASWYLNYNGDHEVYTTADTSFGFYVTVGQNNKVTVEIYDRAKLNQNAQYNQFEMFKFYNTDKTGLAVAYITGKKDAAPETGTFRLGLADNVVKTVDGWLISIDGVRMRMTDDADLYDLDGTTLDLQSFGGKSVVLYNLKDGKIRELHVLAYKYGLTQEYPSFGTYETPFGLGETAYDINTKNGYIIINAGINSVSLSGDPRIELDAVLDPRTAFIDGARIYDLTGNDPVVTTDLTRLTACVNNGRYNIAFIAHEPTNQIFYIIITLRY